MFTDPQSITISGTATPLPKISSGDMSSKYRTASGDLTLSIQHTAARRERSVIRLDRNKVGADPLDSTKSRSYGASVYLVVDAPLNGVGFTDAELEADMKGLTTLLNSTGFALKFLGKES